MSISIADSISNLPFIPRPSTPPLEDRPSSAGSSQSHASSNHTTAVTTMKGLLKRPRKNRSSKKTGPRVRFTQNEVRIFEPKSPAAHNRGTFFQSEAEFSPQTDVSSSVASGLNSNNVIPGSSLMQGSSVSVPPRDNAPSADGEDFIPVPPRRPRRKSWETLPPRDVSDNSEDEDFDDEYSTDDASFVVPPRFSSSPILHEANDATTNQTSENRPPARGIGEGQAEWLESKLSMLREAQIAMETELKEKEEAFSDLFTREMAALELAKRDLAEEKEKVESEKRSLIAEKAAFMSERETFLVERVAFQSEKETFFAEKKKLSSKSRSLKTKEELFRRRVASFEEEKKQAEAVMKSKVDLEAEIEQLRLRKLEIEQLALDALARTMDSKLSDNRIEMQSRNGVGTDTDKNDAEVDGTSLHSQMVLKTSFSNNQFRAVPSIPHSMTSNEQTTQSFIDGNLMLPPPPPPPAKNGREIPPPRKRKKSHTGPNPINSNSNSSSVGDYGVRAGEDFPMDLQYGNYTSDLHRSSDDSTSDSSSDSASNSVSNSSSDNDDQIFQENRVYEMRGVPPPPARDAPQYPSNLSSRPTPQSPRQWFDPDPMRAEKVLLHEPGQWYGADPVIPKAPNQEGSGDEHPLPLPPRPSRENIPPRSRRQSANKEVLDMEGQNFSVKELARTLSKTGMKIFAKGMQ